MLRPVSPGGRNPAPPTMTRLLRLPLLALAASLAAAQPAPPRPATPPVQLLVPGFSVQELPLDLRNLNNLVHAPDGRLFALGYDGNVHQLHDTDGDGRADRATLFWDNRGNEIPPSIGMAWGPGGLYLASRGRVLHLRDRGDGTAELLTVTSGWVPPTAAAGSNLDAVGLAVDAAGNLYFGLGCDAWNGAYRLNRQTGVADYNPFSERGTILRLSPDGKRRDILATGLRFPVSLAFNAAGDLFCSDQEGATWLPNGNPFDELLHIQTGRHYGFPPRHPRHLPGVIDEPSVFDYGPQHQSTCGIHFNEGVAGRDAIFGPSWWRGDVFVAGESRGKLWRTKLVKTPAGYVARNDLIACVSMLTIDAVPTPSGDLLVACHSGGPDWGTGPQGKGKVFRLSYTGRDEPQPVLAYASGPGETRVIFDRPLDPAAWRTIASGSRLRAGPYAAAGDRFEAFAPGYQVVKQQRTTPPVDIPVLSAGLGADRRSLVVRSAPRTAATYYPLTIPQARPRPANAVPGELPQEAAVDLLTDLTGLEAEWRDASGRVGWRGWLPHADLTVARTLTSPSAEHAELFSLLSQPGRLVLRGQLDLNLMLRPAIQPGAKLDFDYPAEQVILTCSAPLPIEVRTNAAARLERRSPGEITLTTSTQGSPWLPLELELTTGPGASLTLVWHTGEDHRPRALPLRRLLLPWAKPFTESAPATDRVIPEIAGGDWTRGRAVFQGNKAACSACHQVRGQGGVVGPDLSNLVYRDYESVLKDIVQPSAAINPDRIAYQVELKSGATAHGIILEETSDHLVLADAAGNSRQIPRTDIARREASTTSLMPEGLWQNLNDAERRDLMTFLLTEPRSTAN